MQPVFRHMIYELLMAENAIVFSSANQITSRYSSTNHRSRRSQLISVRPRVFSRPPIYEKIVGRKNLAGKNIQCVTVKRRRLVGKKFQEVGN